MADLLQQTEQALSLEAPKGDQPPSTQEAFGDLQGQVPTIGQAFGDLKSKSFTDYAGDYYDAVFNQNPYGKILKHFGQDLSNDWGGI